MVLFLEVVLRAKTTLEYTGFDSTCQVRQRIDESCEGLKLSKTTSKAGEKDAGSIVCWHSTHSKETVDHWKSVKRHCRAFVFTTWYAFLRTIICQKHRLGWQEPNGIRAWQQNPNSKDPVTSSYSLHWVGLIWDWIWVGLWVRKLERHSQTWL